MTAALKVLGIAHFSRADVRALRCWRDDEATTT
jgi:hypothetical protein